MILLWRVQSTGHDESWAPAQRAAASFLAQAGTLKGLTELRRGLVLDLNPVVTAKVDGGESDTDRSWRYDAGTPEFGGNIRWGLTESGFVSRAGLAIAAAQNPITLYGGKGSIAERQSSGGP